jgi:hypothetical protein
LTIYFGQPFALLPQTLHIFSQMIDLRLLVSPIAIFSQHEWIDILWINGAFCIIFRMVLLFITTALGILIVEVLIYERRILTLQSKFSILISILCLPRTVLVKIG